jgi:hypothetical protein
LYNPQNGAEISAAARAINHLQSVIRQQGEIQPEIGANQALGAAGSGVCSSSR